MSEVKLSVPRMWADHHVTAVRELLSGLPGVRDIQASSAFFAVKVEFDPEVTSAETIDSALTEAGYEPDQPLDLTRPLDPSRDGSAWYTAVSRVSSTNEQDLVMSGDFRKY
jgi:copper chaperone CopZ